MSLDAVLTIDPATRLYDIDIASNGDIETADFLDTAILYSLFGERRASSFEVSDARYRRGWIGNEGNEFENGSKLWLYSQSRITRTILAHIEDEAAKSLEWLVSDGLAVAISNVSASVSSGRVLLNLTIERSADKVERRYYELWNNTGIR